MNLYYLTNSTINPCRDLDYSEINRKYFFVSYFLINHNSLKKQSDTFRFHKKMNIFEKLQGIILAMCG